MASEKQIVKTIATNMTLDTSSAKESLKDLTGAVKESNNEAKILEAQYRAAGDTVNASKAKYEGLQQTLENQKTKVDAIKMALEQNNTETKKGQEVQALLQNQLAGAERQYASYQGQLDKATQSYKYQQSGLASLTSELKHNQEMTDARVRSLQAEGREDEANKIKLDGLKQSTENLTKQYEIQKTELEQLGQAGDKSSDAYKRQALRVELMGAKLAESKRDINNFNSTPIKPEIKGTGSVKEKLQSLDSSLEGTRSHFKEFLGANLIANGINNAFDSVKSHITGVFQAGVEYNKQIEGMKLGLDNFTNGNKELSGQLSDIIQKAHEANGYSLGTMSALAKKSYGIMGKNIEKTKELTEAFGEVGRATGKTDDDMQALAGTFTKIAAGGDVSKKSFKQLEMQLPGFSQAVADHMGIAKDKLADAAKAGKISMEDLGDGIEQIAKVKGARGLENYEKSFEGFTQHFSERYKSLSGKITESFFNTNNAALGGLSKVLDGPEVDKAFTRIGDSASKAMSAVTKAFSGVFGGSKTNPVADMANWTASAIEKLGDFVAKHASDIKELFTTIKELGATAFGAVKESLKVIIPMMETVGKFAKDHPALFKILAASIIGVDLALKGTLATMGAFGKAKTAFMGLSGLFIKPRVDGSDAKRELGIISKMAVGIGKGVLWTAKLAVKSVLKVLEGIGDVVIGIGKGMAWTAKLAWTGVKKAFSGIVTGAKLVGKGLKWTASIATKGAELALKGLAATGKATGNALKLAFNFAKANPLIMIASAITLVVVGLVELYKHNKKFKQFVDGLVKAAKDFYTGIAKWFGEVWKTISKVFGNVLNFFKKDWKEILLLIVNPFAGAFALLYKHNDNFRKSVNELAKSIKDILTDIGKFIGNIFNSIVKFIGNCWNIIYKTTSNIGLSIIKFVIDTFNSIFKNISNIFNAVANFIGDTLKSIWNNWVNMFKSIAKFFGDIWNGIKGVASDSISAVWNTLKGGLDRITSTFTNAWDSVKKGFNDLWDSMKKLAADGINMVIHPINDGIGGIDDLIHDFGGPKHAIGKINDVHFANGTGAFSGERKPITKPTLALLNDGVDSPETGNKEALVHPNGKMEIVEGNNVNRWLAPGTEVINAKELAMLMKSTPFAGGTGFLGHIWDGIKSVGSFAGKAWDGMASGVEKFTKMIGFITDAIAHPVETLQKQFDPKANGLGKLFDNLGSGIVDKTKDTAKGWWSELWGMAQGAGDGGSSSELLNNAEKFGNGKPYVWGADGADAFDCSGLVQYTLSQMGKQFPHYSGDQYNATTAVSDPQPGDLVFFGPGGGDHVGIYAGGGKMYSAMSPGSTPNIGMANISDWSEKLAEQPYRRVPGLSSGNSDSVQAKKPLQSLIKSQVGGMFDWIQKTLGPLMGGGSGTNGDVNSWSGDVKRALQQLGLSTSDAMVQKVLRQIQTESGGNASIRQQIIDVNSGGNEAQGLMQVTPSTFNAFKLPGHGNILNGYDNILAGLNYAKERYGSDLSFLGQGHGYANGGLITKHQVAEIGEGNQPEMIIPLDSMKSSRGFELLGKTAVAMAARDGKKVSNTDEGESLSSLSSKFDQMIGLLSQLVSGQQEPTPAYVVANQAQSELDKLKQQRNTLNILAKG